jgi:hypothetical protein
MEWKREPTIVLDFAFLPLFFWRVPFLLLKFASFLLRVELKWFLIALSVLPGSNLDISAHLFPNFWCALRMILSSSSLHFPLRMSGLRWLCHLSLHCFPMRPFSLDAIKLQFFAPNLWTSSTTVPSSSWVQGPLTRSGLRTFCHLWRHCTSDRLSKYCAIFFQLLAPNLATSVLSFSSYSLKIRWYSK